MNVALTVIPSSSLYNELSEFNYIRNNVDLITCSILEKDVLRERISKIDPDIIVHLAYVDDDFAETNMAWAFSVNVRGTVALVDICNELDKELIYIRDDDRSGKTTTGLSRWMGEICVKDMCKKYRIFSAEQATRFLENLK